MNIYIIKCLKQKKIIQAKKFQFYNFGDINNQIVQFIGQLSIFIEHFILNIEKLLFLSRKSHQAFIFYIEHLNFTE